MLLNGISHHNGIHMMMHGSSMNGIDSSNLAENNAASQMTGSSGNSSGQPAPTATVTVHLVSQPRSHAFQERWIPLSGSNGDNNDVNTLCPPPVKIGRLVARVKPAAENAIFDCKVLSRNHALLWQDEAGRVWLKDTKSSNGTFVNGQRLSKGGEESQPRELFTGDIVQFGVEVIENQLTHGCIISQVTIFNSDGSERKRKLMLGSENHFEYAGAPFRQSSNAGATNTNPISLYGMSAPGYGPAMGSVMTQEQLFQITHYIQEASHREQALEKKIHSLQEVIQEIFEASESTWQVILNEQKLLNKVRSLEELVGVYSENFCEEGLRCRLVRAVEARQAIEEKLQGLLDTNEQDRLFLLNKLSDCELQYAQRDDECAFLRQKSSELETNYTQLSRSYEEQSTEMEDLRMQLKNMEEQLSQAQRKYAHLQDNYQQKLANEELMHSYQRDREIWLQRDQDYQAQIHHLLLKLEGWQSHPSSSTCHVDIQVDVRQDFDDAACQTEESHELDALDEGEPSLVVQRVDADYIAQRLKSESLKNLLCKSLKSDSKDVDDNDALAMLDMVVDEEDFTQQLDDFFEQLRHRASSPQFMEILDALRGQFQTCVTFYHDELLHLRSLKPQIPIEGESSVISSIPPVNLEDESSHVLPNDSFDMATSASSSFTSGIGDNVTNIDQSGILSPELLTETDSSMYSCDDNALHSTSPHTVSIDNKDIIQSSVGDVSDSLFPSYSLTEESDPVKEDVHSISRQPRVFNVRLYPVLRV